MAILKGAELIEEVLTRPSMEKYPPKNPHMRTPNMRVVEGMMRKGMLKMLAAFGNRATIDPYKKNASEWVRLAHQGDRFEDVHILEDDEALVESDTELLTSKDIIEDSEPAMPLAVPSKHRSLRGRRSARKSRNSQPAMARAR